MIPGFSCRPQPSLVEHPLLLQIWAHPCRIPKTRILPFPHLRHRSRQSYSLCLATGSLFLQGFFPHVRRHLFISPYSATRLARVANFSTSQARATMIPLPSHRTAEYEIFRTSAYLRQGLRG